MHSFEPRVCSPRFKRTDDCLLVYLCKVFTKVASRDPGVS